MKDQWQRVARTYDELIGESGDLPHQLLFNPALESFIHGKHFSLVLDAGCGNGYWTRRLAKQSKMVIGVDASPEMVKIAQGKPKSCDVEYRLGDLEKELPFADGTFDLVFSNMVFHYVRDLDVVAHEMFRILRKRGLLVFSVSHPLYESKKDPRLWELRNRTPFTTNTLGGKGELEEYYEPVDGYKRTFERVGFYLLGFKEPKIPKRIARLYPRYRDFVGVPRAAVFCYRK